MFNLTYIVTDYVGQQETARILRHLTFVKESNDTSCRKKKSPRVYLIFPERKAGSRRLPAATALLELRSHVFLHKPQTPTKSQRCSAMLILRRNTISERKRLGQFMKCIYKKVTHPHTHTSPCANAYTVYIYTYTHLPDDTFPVLFVSLQR